jgi:hypothetical protein
MTGNLQKLSWVANQVQKRFPNIVVWSVLPASRSLLQSCDQSLQTWYFTDHYGEKKIKVLNVDVNSATGLQSDTDVSGSFGRFPARLK